MWGGETFTHRHEMRVSREMNGRLSTGGRPRTASDQELRREIASLITSFVLSRPARPPESATNLAGSSENLRWSVGPEDLQTVLTVLS